MNKSILLTRPTHDRTVIYISRWAEKVINFAKEKGDKILDLFGEKANKQQFESMLKKQCPSYCYLNGHGDSKCITGQYNIPLVTINNNHDILTSKVVYGLSCSAAKELGPACVKSGTKAFIGYNDDYIFTFDDNSRTRPLDDKLAKLFLEPSNLISTSLIKGHTVSESIIASKNALARNISKALTSEAKAEERAAAPFLIWDLENLTFYGEPGAKI
ncbi:MAG: hypothetical protein WCT08_01340 [Patescibacteria group bacterium]|jgi:hypothetical protein